MPTMTTEMLSTIKGHVAAFLADKKRSMPAPMRMPEGVDELIDETAPPMTQSDATKPQLS